MIASIKSVSTRPQQTREQNYRLGQGCSIKHGFAFKGEFLITDDVDLPIVVNIVNFRYTGGFRFETTKIQRYTGSYPNEFELRPGDVLVIMTCQTPKGEILGVPGRIPNDGKIYLHNQRMGLAVIKNPEELDLGFLYWLFLSPRFNQHLFATATGAKILHTAPKRIEDYRFARPPIGVQRKIAAILSAYNDLIENNQRRIRLLEEMAATVYREWFVHFRFPGHEAVPIVDGMPEGWRQTQLVNVADVNASSIGKTYEADTINYVDIASVSTGHIDAIQSITLADAPGRARRIVRHGDIIWSTVRPNRKSYSLILNPLPDLIVSTGFAVISAKQAPYSYLYFALTTDDFATYLTNRAIGAAYPAVSSGDFERAEVLLPDKSILDAFDSIVADMLDLKHTLSQKNANLRQTRDLILPKLISGDLDVEHLDINTEALDE